LRTPAPTHLLRTATTQGGMTLFLRCREHPLSVRFGN
jgi:hypothetical protein